MCNYRITDYTKETEEKKCNRENPCLVICTTKLRTNEIYRRHKNPNEIVVHRQENLLICIRIKLTCKFVYTLVPKKKRINKNQQHKKNKTIYIYELETVCRNDSICGWQHKRKRTYRHITRALCVCKYWTQFSRRKSKFMELNFYMRMT